MSNSTDNVHAGHRDRLRKRFLEEGLDAFKPHEILELLLFYAIPRKDTNELAHQLLSHFHNSLPAVLEAGYEDLLAVKGISKNSACLIKMMLPLFRQYGIYQAKESHCAFETTRQITDYVRTLFFDCAYERMYCICLSPGKKIIRTILLGEGDQGTVSVSIPKAVSLILQQNASAVILAHNHPNGVATYSTKDYDYTLKLKRALDTLEIELVDHILVTEEKCVSLIEMGGVEKIMGLHSTYMNGKGENAE